jgi:tetratricopeptide (TPR) repeat protein
MKKHLFLLVGIFFLSQMLTPGAGRSQYGAGGVHLPYESQKASVSQTIGLTEMEIAYHRPAVKGRKIWGDLVPYNEGVPFPWRVGANENTTISFSTDVTIEGKPLAAGKYGLHMIPGENEWIIIFSKNNSSWGSFSYDKKEDALRVTVKPQPAEFEEFLTFEFANPEANKVMAQLRWEKLKVGFAVEANTHEVVLASIRKELRSTPGFTWRGYEAAASYCADENFNFDEALVWANRSVSTEENFDNLQTLSELQMKMGKPEESLKTMDKAMAIAKPMELQGYGRQLLREKRADEAMKIFEYNLKKNPDQWFVYSGMARGYEAKGDMKKAIENMKLALDKAPDNSKPGIQTTIKQWESK